MATEEAVGQQPKTHVESVVQCFAVPHRIEPCITENGKEGSTNGGGHDQSSEPGQLSNVEDGPQFSTTRRCNHEFLNSNHVGKNPQRDGERKGREHQLGRGRPTRTQRIPSNIRRRRRSRFDHPIQSEHPTSKRTEQESARERRR